MTVEGIACQRGLNETTVYTHLAGLIEQGQLDVAEVVELPGKELDALFDTVLAHGDEPFKLKPVYDALGGAYSYGVLRCVRAAIVRKTAA